MFHRTIIATRNILNPRRCVPGLSRAWVRQEHDDRTVVKVLNMETQEGLMVDAYSQMGFRLNNGMSVIGPIALFPKTVLSWQVSSSHDINEDSLSLFYMLEPRIDLLVIGIGDKGSYVDTKIIRFMKNKGVNVEILPTESACTTFNFLNQERRYVAGAFIPPYSLRITQEDIMRTERERKQLYKVSDDDEIF